jgi:ubiquinone/menaquinone biosynthesis C-methylase UbiE
MLRSELLLDIGGCDVGVFTLGREGKFHREFMDMANIPPPSDRVLLDVECGTGTCSILAAYDVGRTGEVVGIEPSSSLLQHARKKAVREFLNNEEDAQVSCDLRLAENISEKDNSFDVVVSTFTLHHLPGDDLQRKALAEMKRVIKPGGKLLLVDFPGGSQHAGHPHGICGSHEVDEENDSVVGIIKEVGFAEVSAQRVRMMGASLLSWLGNLRKPAPNLMFCKQQQKRRKLHLIICHVTTCIVCMKRTMASVQPHLESSCPRMRLALGKPLR